MFELLLDELLLELPEMRVHSLVLFKLLMRQHLWIEWQLTDNDLLELIDKLDLVLVLLLI